MRIKSSIFVALLATSMGQPVWAQAQTFSTPSLSGSQNAEASNPFDAFVPRPTRKTKIDYAIWDALLKEMVFYAGPSLRERADRPDPIVGTRLVYGHTSAYRLEGNKVVFETLNKDFKTYLDDYVADLIDVGNRVDIASFPKNEQLAYWFNLHNALVIQAIADRYPVAVPSRIRGKDGLSFHETKRVEIDGVPLSLKNIREDIVYRNWSDPIVIYGFFHGDLGSPSIQRTAFTGDNLRNTLKTSADEFANSLRAFDVYNGRPRVSRHYEDAAPYFFPNFEADLRAHLGSGLMKQSVELKLRQSRGDFIIMPYVNAIADLTNGDVDRKPIGRVTSSSPSGGRSFSASSALDRALKEQSEKFQKIRERGLFGTVIIEDIDTSSDDGDFIDPRNDGDPIE
jgi:hypothetical protein